ncbi:MAG: YceD family protein [Pseudomonadota bacterium]
MSAETDNIKQLPSVIDPLELAQRRAILKGTLSTHAMIRLQESVEKAEQPVLIDWQCDQDDDGRALLTGNTQTEVELLCRRCLQPMLWQVKTDTKLAILRPGEDISVLDEFEPLEIESGRLSLLALVEDDILLALPLFAEHEHCAENEYVDENSPEITSSEMEQTERENPFSVLRALRERE